MSVDLQAAPVTRGKREVPPGVFLVLGVVVVPAVLALVSPHGSPPRSEGFIWMAFAAVAGQTVACLTVLGVLAAALLRRSSVAAIATFATIAAVVIAQAVTAVNTYADQLARALAS